MTYLEDRDIAPCGRCGKDVVLDHDPPCEHGYVCCDTCDPAAACPECREVAVAEMFSTGDYSEAIDPLVTEPVESEADYLERTRLRSFDTTTNAYLPRKDKSA